mmetsp:Transcript_17866/g.17192  ORF Transcript_17866/g.17192 Transcript_17866/m.17192 type:complete len:134 (+) Transcript_17866:1027-1428(+)
MKHVQEGGRAGILFLIQRDDCISFSACARDPAYGVLLHEAFVAGVSILPYHCRLDPTKGTVELLGRLPFIDLYSNGIVIKAVKRKKRTVPAIEGNLSPRKKIKVESVVGSSIMDMTVESDEGSEHGVSTTLTL